MNALFSIEPASFVIWTVSAPPRAIKSLASGKKIALLAICDTDIGTFAPADAARRISYCQHFVLNWIYTFRQICRLCAMLAVDEI